MKILAYSSATAYGGHEVMALAGLQALLRAGHVVELSYSAKNRKLREASALLAHEHPGRFTARPGRQRSRPLQIVFTWLDWAAIFRLVKAIRRSGCDRLLALQGDIEQGSEALVAAALAGVPSISYIPMIMSGLERGIRLAALRDVLSRPLYSLAKRMLVISPHFQRRATVLGSADTRVVYNCIDDEFFDAPSRRSEARRRLGIGDSERISGFIGRIAYGQKGLDRLLELVSGNVAYFERNRILVVGSGPDDERLAADIEAKSLQRAVIRLPWDDERVSLFDAMDLFLCLSRFEGVPLTVLEASARKIPVLSVPLPTLADHLPLLYLDQTFDAAAACARIVALSDDDRRAAADAAATRVATLARVVDFDRRYVRGVVSMPGGAVPSPSQTEPIR